MGEVDGYMGLHTTDAPGGGGNGAQTFQSEIAPLVTRCIGCHSAAQNPVLTSFDTLGPTYKQKPGASNILVTKGNATGGQHEGITYFSTTEQATVAAWIDSL